MKIGYKSDLPWLDCLPTKDTSAEAQQQVALGFAEARVAATDVTSAEDYLNAADILMSIHEYPLAQRMYGRAQALGADDTRWRWVWQMRRWPWETRVARNCNWPAWRRCGAQEQL